MQKTRTAGLRKQSFSILILGALSLSACGQSTAPTLTNGVVTENVTVANGMLMGNPRDASGVLSFKGIPYAAAPVGDLRWKAPQPAAKWSDVKSAQNYGNKCWEFSPAVSLDTPNGHSEDCLFLNLGM